MRLGHNFGRAKKHRHYFGKILFLTEYSFHFGVDLVEKLQSIEEEEEEETKGELTGKAHSAAGRGREMIIFRLHQEQNITQQHSGGGAGRDWRLIGKSS